MLIACRRHQSSEFISLPLLLIIYIDTSEEFKLMIKINQKLLFEKDYFILCSSHVRLTSHLGFHKFYYYLGVYDNVSDNILSYSCIHVLFCLSVFHCILFSKEVLYGHCYVSCGNSNQIQCFFSMTLPWQSKIR